MADGGRRAEIYTYEASFPIYAANWSERPDKRFRLAVGSFLEEYNNVVQIVTARRRGRVALKLRADAVFASPPQLDEECEAPVFRCDPRFSFPHPYPPTKLQFIPDREGCRDDLLASSGDYLRIWSVGDEGVALRALLNNTKQSEFCAPLTSFDWNSADPRRLATCSIDTTCTVWDVERGCVDTQLIAHDREVYDIAWGGAGVFASVSADGSVRVFDLRDKEHSTIIYEAPQPDTPLLRLAWNKQDPRYMATILIDSAKVVVLDIRFPTLPVAELSRHGGAVNALCWAPHSSCHICSAGDDAQALIWDLSGMAQPSEQGLDPILAYGAGAEINSLAWSHLSPDWIMVAFANKMQCLRV